MSGGRWYAVGRSYRVTDEVYCFASSAAEAREIAENHDYAEATMAEPASATRYSRARRVGDGLAATLTDEHEFVIEQYAAASSQGEDSR